MVDTASRSPAKDDARIKAQQKPGSIKGMVAADVGSSLDRLKQFASKRPYATTATIAVVVGIAFLNALRRKKGR